MKLLKSVSISFASRIAEQVLALITSIIITRMLGPAGKGKFTLIFAVLTIFIQLGNLGLMSPVAYYSAKTRDLAKKTSSVSLAISILWGSFLLLISMIVVRYNPELIKGVNERLVLIALFIIPAALAQLYFSNVLLGIQRIIEFNVPQLLFEVLRLVIAIIVLLFLSKSIFMLVILIVAAYYLIAATNIFLVRKSTHFGIRDFDSSILTQMLKRGFRVYLSTLFAFLVLRSDVLLLNYFKDAYQIGIYSIGVTAADKLMLLPITIGMMLFPKVVSQKESTGELTKKTLRFTSLAMILACLTGLFLGYPAITILFGKAFAPSYLPFIMLLPGVYFLSLETVLMYDFGGRGFPRIVYISPLSGFLLNLALNIFLIPKLGYIGAAITSTIAYLLMLILNSTYFCKITNSKLGEIFFPEKGEVIEVLNQIIEGIKRKGQQIFFESHFKD